MRWKYLSEDVDRHGNLRRYVRLKNRPKVRITETPGTDEFWAAYRAAVDAKPTHEGPGKGTFAALVEAYYASPIFKGWDKSTRGWRSSHLDRICKTDGDKPVALLRTKHIIELRDELAATPGVAAIRLKALKSLFAWALERSLVDVNPAKDVKALSYVKEGHHPWSIEEVEAYEARHPVGSKARLALHLLLYTAGRREDACRFGSANLKDGRVKFTQAKNEHRKPVVIDVRVHPDLIATIEACGVAGNKTFLLSELGKAYTPHGFSQWFAEQCIAADVPGRAHGLRKAALIRYAEAGATGAELQAVGGHSSLQQVEVYIQAANRKHNADAAADKLSAVKTVPPKARRTAPLVAETAATLA